MNTQSWIDALDKRIIRFFSSVLDQTVRIGIPQSILINLAIIGLAASQIGHVSYLAAMGKSTIVIFVIAFPTWIFTGYLFQLARHSKAGSSFIDGMRIFALIFILIGSAYFTYLSVLSLLKLNTFFVKEFWSHVLHLTSGACFTAILYLLSAHTTINKKNPLPPKD